MLRKLSNGLLFPFSLVYGFIIIVRNWLYDKGIYSVFQSPITTINVGNLTVGGTGKSPHVEYLINLLKKNYTIAILSRGYGRKTSGFLKAKDNVTAETIGDEPLQFFQKFKPEVDVFVCEKRAIGLQEIEKENPNISLIVLDDAFQHRAIKPKINILLTDYNRLFYNDLLLPSGRLREPKYGAKRADAIVVSKCPDEMLETNKSAIEAQIQRFSNSDCPIFFSTFQYGLPQPYFKTQPPFNVQNPCVLLSGIAQPQHFEKAAKQKYKIDKHLIFKDHHSFSIQDLPLTNYQILTTEKDFVKILPLLNSSQNNFYFWPIEVHFLENKTQNFDKWLLNTLKKCEK